MGTRERQSALSTGKGHVEKEPPGGVEPPSVPERTRRLLREQSGTLHREGAYRQKKDARSCPEARPFVLFLLGLVVP